jgi:hypothetical protein
MHNLLHGIHGLILASQTEFTPQHRHCLRADFIRAH